MNPLATLSTLGQSPWFDYIRRTLLTSGDLSRLIADDGLRGMTSNPAIFEKAIGGSTDYDEALKALLKTRDADAMQIFEFLAIRDIQDAADILRPVYDRTKRLDGYVSLEVSPYLARETNGSIEEARRLWRAVARENVMIKIPATPEGVPAIEALLGDGININITLLFAQEAYEKVALAHMAGLERFAAQGGDVGRVASVASFFVSRIDSAVDKILGDRLKSSKDAAETAALKALEGKVAIANAKQAYQTYKRLQASDRWKALAKKGAQPQRLLWASTGTKDPRYSDVLYIETLIGKDTVNTIPPATYDAYRDHGKPQADTIESGLDEANRTIAALAKVNVSLESVCNKLVDDAVKLFADAFDKLLAAVEKKRKSIHGSSQNRMSVKLSAELDRSVKAILDDWRTTGKVRRLWARDGSVWTGQDEPRWLGWLTIPQEQQSRAEKFREIAEDVKKAGFTHALLLGMGGSSLAPEVLRETFGDQPGSPRLHVLDSTDPAQIKTFEGKIDLERTIFIVSSKSGSTLEPNIYKAYFFEKLKEKIGAVEAAKRFVAITDPGSQLDALARKEGFRRVFSGVPCIGGRYSALSDFGMIPAAIMGIDVPKFIDTAREMLSSCAPSVPPEENPGVYLGAILGAAAKAGRDKLTIVASPGLHDVGAWLEQLVAESTGKLGKGIVPVDREDLGPPAAYGDDRVFAYLRLDSAPSGLQDARIDALEAAGHPVVRIALATPFELGEEFFRWEIATAVAGSVLGINPFDQPDVEAAKIESKKLTSEYEAKGSLPAEKPLLEKDGVGLYAPAAYEQKLKDASKGDLSLVGVLRAHLATLQPHDYLAILAYVEMNAAHEATLQAMRHRVRDAKKVATCLGFGPRFLHSTGQMYKGGPNSGVVLQVTCDDANDLQVPGAKYTFGVVKSAQARGDFQVLGDRGRRALRVHLGKDVAAGLKMLNEAVAQALTS